MKTVEEIKDKIKEVKKYYEGLIEKTSFTGGLFIGWSDALHWILEDSKNADSEHI